MNVAATAAPKAIATFCNMRCTAPTDPCFSFETDAMIEAIFAGWKMPPPIPYRNNTLANRYGDHCASIKLRPTNAINIIPKPTLINKVVPKRPMNFPAILEKITSPSGADSKTKPVCNGVNDVKFCKKYGGTINIIADATPNPIVASIGTIKVDLRNKCTSIIGCLVLDSWNMKIPNKTKEAIIYPPK